MNTEKLRVRSIAFHPNGKWLAIAGKSNTIILCDLKDLSNIEPKYIKTDGIGEEISSITFNYLGVMAAAGKEGNVDIRRDIKELESKILIRAHKGEINKIQFSSKKPNELFTAGKDGFVRRWIPNISEGKLIGYKYDPIEYKVTKDDESLPEVILSFALTNDENYLAAGTDKGFLHLWNLNPEILTNNITSLTWRDLTDQEKNIYIDRSLSLFSSK